MKSFTLSLLIYLVTCEDFGYVSLNSTKKCLKHHHVPLSWMDANNTCVSEGGNLFSITSLDMMEEVLNITFDKGIVIIQNIDTCYVQEMHKIFNLCYLSRYFNNQLLFERLKHVNILNSQFTKFFLNTGGWVYFSYKLLILPLFQLRMTLLFFLIQVSIKKKAMNITIFSV